MLARPPRRAGERVAYHPLDAERGVDADLGGDLVLGVLAQQPAVAGVGPLGALAHDHHVDLVRAGQRPAHAGVEPGRAEVDVVVELEPQAQQQPPLEDAAWHRRVADRAEQDGVVLAQLAEHRLRQQLAGASAIARHRGRRSSSRHPARLRASTFNASSMTSGPMPSPGMTARRMPHPLLSPALLLVEPGGNATPRDRAV